MRMASVAVVIPTLCGGRLLEEVVAMLNAQGAGRPDILLVDSGSPEAELGRLRNAGARIQSVDRRSFDHGLTRDFGASETAGDVIVFLNQDALPVDELWIERLVSPFLGPDPPAAVQGGIRELPPEPLAKLGRRRFFWDSCGPRFYFTSESETWIARHGGIGFSTVNCAIARWAWEALPFGRAAILEDKLWQKGAVERGWRIEAVPEAAVWHTHDYDVRSLVKRCVSEGFGWRLVGERYRLPAAFADLRPGPVWNEWRQGLRTGAMRTAAERLFPLLRPLALWWGNRWSRRVYL